MNRKIEKGCKNISHHEKHVQVAKTLSQAAELTGSMEETNREINDMMKKFYKNTVVEE